MRCNRAVLALKVELSVDLVRQHQDLLPPTDLGDLVELGWRVRGAGRIGGVVEEEQAPRGPIGDRSLQVVRSQAVAVLGLRAKPAHCSAGELGLGTTSRPCGCGQQQLASEAIEQQERELPGAGADEHVLLAARESLAAPMIVGHRTAQLGETSDR
jgi:hypothetical protein